MSVTTLAKRWIGIVTGKNCVAIKQGIGKYYSKSEIAGYYNDLTGKVNEGTLLDTEGIPINIIENGKKVYFPISIFQYALGLYDLYLEKRDDNTKQHFLKLSNWIVDNQEADGAWNCFGPIGYRKMTVSSMGQGEAISVLVRAYILTHEDSWINAAQKAAAFMIVEVKNGGTLLLEHGNTIFEEYANTEGDKKSVLNGWIFSLFGLFDYLKVVDDKEIKQIYLDSLQTLSEYVDKYDCGYWSLYDQTGRLASPAYHDLHICLLRALADVTEIEHFSEIADKWAEYQKNILFKGLAIAKKIVQKLGDNPEGIIVQ